MPGAKDQHVHLVSSSVATFTPESRRPRCGARDAHRLEQAIHLAAQPVELVEEAGGFT
jgi:hypothetical protein